MPKLDFVLKFVAMEKDILQIAMMEIMLMGMDAAKIATFKSDSHVTVDLQVLKTHVLLFFLQPYQLNQEVNQDFTEKLF